MRLAPHAGDAPTPTVRQTVMLLLQQWGKLHLPFRIDHLALIERPELVGARS